MAKVPVKQAPTQRQRFIEAARAVGATEDKEGFKQRRKAVAGANSARSKGAKRPPKRG